MTRVTIHMGDELPLTAEDAECTAAGLRDKVAKCVDDGLALVMPGPERTFVVNPAHIRFAVVTP